MAKILLSSKNSAWGLQTDSYGNTYVDHTVDFPDDKTGEQKWEFLANEMFNGKDPRELIKDQPDIENPVITASDITFKINKGEYPETLDQLLRKDFAVLQQDEQYQFYAIEGKLDKKKLDAIIYTGKRDWLFELGINNIFRNDRQVEIERADANDIIQYQDDSKWYWNNQMDGDNSFPEDFEDFEDSHYYPTYTENLKVDYTRDIVGDANTKKEVNDLLNSQSFAIVYLTLGEDKKIKLGENTNEGDLDFGKSKAPIESLKTSIGDILDPVDVGYYVLLIPLFKYRYEDEAFVAADFSPFFNKIKESPNVLNAFLVQAPIISQGEFTYEKVDEVDKAIKMTMDWDLAPIRYGICSSTDSPFAPDYYYFYFKKTRDWDVSVINTHNNNEANYETDINKPFVMENISKLHKWPYERIYLTNINKVKIFAQQQMLKNKFSWQFSTSLNPEMYRTMVKINDIDNPEGIYNNNLKYGQYSQDINNLNLVRMSSEYLNTIALNQSSLNLEARIGEREQEYGQRQAKWDYSKAWVNGIVGAIGGILSGGLGAITGGLNAITGIGSAVSKYQHDMLAASDAINQYKAKIADLKNSPRSVIGSKDDLYGINDKTNLTYLEVNDTLWPALKEKIAYYFQVYGSNLGGMPRNINDYIDNKYHKNFLKTGSIFENIKQEYPLTNHDREILNLSFNNGITVWHYRDKKTFKGIKNYDVNNVDTDKAKI